MKRIATLPNRPATGTLSLSSLLKYGLISIILTMLAATFWSCEKEAIEDDAYPQVQQSQGVFILNEGNFNSVNASVSYYNKESKTSYHELFLEVNGETPGDLLQSVTLHEDQLWMVINNSGKIEIMDPVDGQRTGTVTGLESPRYMLPWPSLNKAYVTDLYASRVNIIDLNTRAVTGHIPVNGWSEAIIEAGNKVIVSGMTSGMLYAIDPQTDQMTDSLLVGDSPESMVLDNQGMLWVLCQGAYPDYNTASLVKVDPASWEVLNTYMLPAQGLPWSRLRISAQQQQLYFLGGDVYTFDLQAAQPQPMVFVSGEGMSLYGLGVDPYNGDVYVSDAIDFNQQGRIKRYSSAGNPEDEFAARNIPSGFLFY